MPTFGDYETIGEPIESREEKAHFTRVWQARKINAKDGRLYAVKCYIPRRRQRAEGEGGAALEEHGSLEFLEGVKQIKKAAAAGPKCLTPIHDFGLTPTGDGAWYVTDFYGDAAPILPRTLRSFITRGGRVDGAALRHAIHDVALGCLTLQRSRGYSHGNLKPSNVFRAGKPGSLRKTPLLLGDAFPVAPLLLAQQDAQSKLEVDSLLKETMEAHDLRAIGELMLQLVEVRLLKQEGDYDYPVTPSPAWSRLGKDGERWRDLCNRLLDPNLSLERMNFELLEKEVRPGLVSKCVPLAAGAAVLLCLVVAGILWLVHYEHGRGKVEIQENPPHAGVVSGGGSFATNSLVTVTAKANSGYTFTNWTENGTVQTNSPNYAFTLSSNRHLVANFTSNPPTYYLVAPSSVGNGSISPNGQQTVVKGGSVTFTANPASGYVVNQWLVNSSPAQTNGTSYRLNNVMASASVQVTFKPAPPTNYAVTASAGANGSISPNVSQTVVKGGSVTFTANPASGYVVNQWLVNGSVAQTNGTSYTLNNVTASASVEVTFKPAPPTNYTVTASAGANGSISPSGQQSVVKGGSVTFTANPASGYVVNQWLVNSSPAQSGGTSYILNNVTASASVEATFKPAPPTNYAVTASAGANGSISPSGQQTVVKGGSVTFTANPANGYVVNQWLVNSSPAQSGGTSYILNNVTAPASVQATFRAALTPTDHRPTNFFGLFDKSLPDLDFVWLDAIGPDRHGAYVAVNELSWGQYKALGGTNMPAVSSLSPSQPAAWSGQVGLANARSFVDLLNNNYATKQVKFRLPGLDEYVNLSGVPDFLSISNLVVTDRSDGESFVGSAAPRDITNLTAALAKGVQATNKMGLRNVIGNVREWTANGVPFGYAYSWGYYHSLTNKPLEDEQIGLRLICEPANR